MRSHCVLLPPYAASSGQTSRCNLSSARAASPLGSFVRPLATSLTPEVDIPIFSPISDSVCPASCRSRILLAQEFMGADITVSRKFRQRHTVTEFRSNVSMGADLTETMGDRIKRLREQNGLSQAQLGDRAGGMSVSAISGLEIGTQRGSSYLDRLAAALGTTTTYLRDGVGSTEATDAHLGLSAREISLLESVRLLDDHQMRDLELFLMGLSRGAARVVAKKRSGKIPESEKLPEPPEKIARNRRSG